MGEMPTRHLIIADDDAISSLALERYLERKGFRVSLAANGQAALDIHALDPADLLMTDMRMPRLSGPELVRCIRAGSPDLPVIIATGYAADDPEIPSGPGTLVLGKPLSPQEVLAAVRGLLGLDPP